MRLRLSGVHPPFQSVQAHSFLRHAISATANHAITHSVMRMASMPVISKMLAVWIELLCFALLRLDCLGHLGIVLKRLRHLLKHPVLHGDRIDASSQPLPI